MTGNTTAVVVTLSFFSFGLMAAIAVMTAGLIALLVAGLSAASRPRGAVAAASAPAPTPASGPVPAEEGIDPAVVAAISAAVHAVAGAHRIVWIGETPPSGGWTSEVRQKHHGSHRPHHDH